MLTSFILFPNLPFHCTQSGMVSSLMWLEGECLQETEIGTREISEEANTMVPESPDEGLT